MNSEIAYAVSLLVSSAAMGLLLSYAIKHRGFKGGVSFSVILAGTIIWSLMKAGEVLSPDLSTKFMFLKLQYTGIILIPPALLVFVLRFTGSYRDVDWRDIGLILFLPVIVYGFVVTNEYHGFFWRSVNLVPGDFDHLAMTHGWVFYVQIVYSYALVIISLVLLSAVFVRDKGSRVHLGALLFAILLPTAGGIVIDLGFSPWDHLDATPLLFWISGAILAVAIFKFGLFERQPVTRDMIFENIADPIVFLDEKRKVVDLNTAAEELSSK